MGRIEERFQKLKIAGRKAFMPFITACDPSPDATVEIIAALEAAGADMVEIGFPYSDPLADGPVIQDSYARVLGDGRTVDDVFEVVGRVRERSEMPLAGMVSFSIVWKKGLEWFTSRAAAAGFDALIIPDLPPEEAAQLLCAAERNHIGIVFLVTPTTDEYRAREIVKASTPFIYYVSVVGITGAREALPSELADGVSSIKAITDKPVVVGFGVSRPAQAASVASVADGVIVGSAIVRVISENRALPTGALAKAVEDFARPLAAAVKS